MNETPAEFRPDYAVPPGDTIREMMDGQMLCEEDLAVLMDYDIEFICDLLAGETPLTPTVAKRLECALGVTKEFWLAREEHYRAARLKVRRD